VVVVSAPVVHEEVHQRAGGKQQPGERRDHVRSMLRQEEVRRDREEPEHNEVGAADSAG
jgi:hypothetical protein